MSYTVMADEILEKIDSMICYVVTEIRNDYKRAEEYIKKL